MLKRCFIKPNAVFLKSFVFRDHCFQGVTPKVNSVSRWSETFPGFCGKPRGLSTAQKSDHGGGSSTAKKYEGHHCENSRADISRDKELDKKIQADSNSCRNVKTTGHDGTLSTRPHSPQCLNCSRCQRLKTTPGAGGASVPASNSQTLASPRGRPSGLVPRRGKSPSVSSTSDVPQRMLTGMAGPAASPGRGRDGKTVGARRAPYHSDTTSGQDAESWDRLRTDVWDTVGRPDWTRLVRDMIVGTSGEASEELVDSSIIPTVSSHLTDEKLVKESLMVLLMACVINNKTRTGNTQPSINQTTLATTLMMMRTMTRLHSQLQDVGVDVVRPVVQFTVLAGDLFGCSLTKAIAGIGVPRVSEIMFTAVSDLARSCFPKVIYPDTTQLQDDGQHPTNYHFEDTPVPLSCACEAIALESGLDKPLVEVVRRFGHHISMARFLNLRSPEHKSPEPHKTPVQDSKSHHLTGLENLQRLDECRELEMLRHLASVYVCGESI